MRKGTLYAALIAILVLGMFTGYLAGYHEAIGAFPPILFLDKEPILPPSINTQHKPLTM